MAYRPPSMLVAIAVTMLGIVLAAFALAVPGIAVARAVADGPNGEVLVGGAIGGVVIGMPAFLALAIGIKGLRSSRFTSGIDLTPDKVGFGVGHDQIIVRWDEIGGLLAHTVTYRSGRAHITQNWLSVTAHETATPYAAGRRTRARVAKTVLRSAAESMAKSAMNLQSRTLPELIVAMPWPRLKTDPLVVYHGLRFYLDNPAARDELSSEAAVNRLNSRRLPS